MDNVHSALPIDLPVLHLPNAYIIGCIDINLILFTYVMGSKVNLSSFGVTEVKL